MVAGLSEIEMPLSPAVGPVGELPQVGPGVGPVGDDPQEGLGFEDVSALV